MDLNTLTVRLTTSVPVVAEIPDDLFEFWSVSVEPAGHTTGRAGAVANDTLVRIVPDRFAATGTSVAVAADVLDPDLADAVAAAFDGRSDPAPLADWFGEPVQRVLLLDRVQVDRDWRGHDLGRRLAAVAIDRLVDTTTAVVVHPSPFLLDCDDPGWGDATDRLVSMWAGLGFVPYADGLAAFHGAFANPWLDAYLPASRG